MADSTGPSKKITQKDVARRARVTQATVSLALGNHPSIPLKTRNRVQAIAQKMGYTPDPYLSGLSAYRKRIKPAQFQATLAWLSNYPEGTTWKKSHVFRGYFEGASARAGQLGYRLEEHLLQSEDMTSRRMERILAARNIPGILLAPQPQPDMKLDFRFDRFSAVTFGFTLVEPQLHLVALQTFRSMETVFRRLTALGYRRPGLAMAMESDLRAGHNWSAAFWSEQRTLPARDRLPLLQGAPFTRDAFLRWFNRHRPDVIISMSDRVHGWLVEEGFAVPKDVGVALLTVPDEGRYFSGIWENPQVIGAKAVEFLIDLVHRGEYGVPQVPLCLLVAGTWQDGKTVLTKHSSKPHPKGPAISNSILFRQGPV